MSVASPLRQALDADMPEAAMYAALAKAAQIGGWLFIHHHDSRHSAAGFPDILAIREGEMVVWEAKRQHGKTTPAQDAWLAAFRAFFEAHGIGPEFMDVRVIRPADLRDCIERLASRPGLPRAEVL